MSNVTSRTGGLVVSVASVWLWACGHLRQTWSGLWLFPHLYMGTVLLRGCAMGSAGKSSLHLCGAYKALPQRAVVFKPSVRVPPVFHRRPWGSPPGLSRSLGP